MTIKDLLEGLMATHGETRVYVGGAVIAVNLPHHLASMQLSKQPLTAISSSFG